MAWLIGALLLPSCAVVAGLIVRRWCRHASGVVRVEQAHAEFRLRREWLEARFLDALGRVDPVERLRWEEAHWEDEVVWARDRRSGRLLALIGVYFEPDPLVDLPGHPPRHATVVFEYHRRHWRTEGRCLEEIHPHEAFLRHQQFEPVVTPPNRRV